MKGKAGLQFWAFLGTLVVAAALFVFFPRVSLPFMVAYIISLSVRPLMPAIYKQSRITQVLLFVSLGSFLLMAVFKLISVTPELRSEWDKLESYLPKAASYVTKQAQALAFFVEQRLGVHVELDIGQRVVEYAQSTTRSLLLNVPTIVSGLLEWIILVPLFLFFLLRDGRRFRHQVLQFVPNRFFERTYVLFHQFNKKFGDYIFAKVIEATIVGVITAVGLAILGYPFAIVLGLIAALTNIVPYVGPFVGFIPALLIGLVDESVQPLLGPVTLLYLIANLVDLALVFPILVSKIVNLHPAVVVVSVFVGSQVAGIVGMVLSIPFAAFIKLSIVEVYNDLYSR